ncbi:MULTISPECIES: IS5 family transposase [Pseudanabaena]|uniref:Transposase n=2 Tax=Pseudanabaena TaxID=1152 RepID=L8MWH3_9CYAN|nr:MULTISPECIES: IS5 family transposase [Pseudanabaena]ELS32327.1 transposase [Pseudanabaena biceps PCC 7429]MDG3495448.1 IS5 family transposase [Pseudanabaena catenata USMAC16]
MEATKKSYPTDLTDDQWELVKELIPAAGTGGRKRSVDIRAILNAIFYINATGCAWRMLPHDFPVWQTVYGYFRHWRITNTWQDIKAKL